MPAPTPACTPPAPGTVAGVDGSPASLPWIAAAVHAGPSQSSVPPPGGFATACASAISAGVTYTPGLDLTASFASVPTQSTCVSQVFAGAAGVAAAGA